MMRGTKGGVGTVGGGPKRRKVKLQQREWPCNPARAEGRFATSAASGEWAVERAACPQTQVRTQEMKLSKMNGSNRGRTKRGGGL